MLKHISTFCVALALLSACGNQTSQIDHDDPAAVTSAMLAGLRDNDLNTLAYAYHPNHQEGVRQSTLAYSRGEIDAKQWVFSDDRSEIDKYTSNWSGYLKGPKYNAYWEKPEYASADFMMLYAFTKPDRNNEVAVAIVERYEEGWFIDHMTLMDQDDFDGRPKTEDEAREYLEQSRAYEEE